MAILYNNKHKNRQNEAPLNILEFLQFITNEHYSILTAKSNWQDLYAIRLLLQKSQANQFLEELGKEGFFEYEEPEDKEVRDVTRREYIIDLLKQHTPQVVVGEILADIIKGFPKDILPPNKDIDNIDMFAEIVSENSKKKSISINLENIENKSKGNIDVFLPYIAHLRIGALYCLNIEKKAQEKKHNATVDTQYEEIRIEYAKNLSEIKELTDQNIKGKEVASNIIRKNIHDFINILKPHYSNNVELDRFEKQLAELEEELLDQNNEDLTDIYFEEARTLLSDLDNFLKKETVPSEMILYLKNAVVLTTIQADIHILSRNKLLTSNGEDFFSTVPSLIKIIKNNLTTNNQKQTFKKNIKSYLRSCEIAKDNIPKPFSASDPKTQKMLEVYKKLFPKQSVPSKMIHFPPAIVGELKNGKLPPSDLNQLIGNDSYTICTNPSLIINQVNGIKIKFAQSNATGEFYIVKSISIADVEIEHPYYKKLQNENFVLNQLGKTNEPLFEQKNTDGTITVSVISPYIPGYDLRELLGHKKSNNERYKPLKNLTDEERLNIGKNIIEKYLALIGEGFLHRDISHSNIRVNPDTYEVDCIDFADALKIDVHNSAIAEDICAQQEMLAPELKEIPYTHTDKTDMYPLGIILCDLFFNQEYGKPLGHSTNLQHNTELRQLIKEMIDLDPAKRPTLKAVKKTLEKVVVPSKKAPTQGWVGGISGFITGGMIGLVIGFAFFGVGAIPGFFLGIACAAFSSTSGVALQAYLEKPKSEKHKKHNQRMPTVTTNQTSPVTSIARSMKLLIDSKATAHKLQPETPIPTNQSVIIGTEELMSSTPTKQTYSYNNDETTVISKGQRI